MEPDAETVKQHLFSTLFGKTLECSEEFSLQNLPRILQSGHFRRHSSTVLYIHGYKQLHDDVSLREISQAYLETRPEVNVLLLNWTYWSQQSYFNVAAPSTEPVGRALGTAILELVKGGYPLDLLHVVGFSLGAHIAGYTGNYLSQHGLQIARITGLDPAAPDFGLEGPLRSIRAEDAVFVDIIHTDSTGFGMNCSLGHADFWPNGGLGQPGCGRGMSENVEEMYGSHNRAWAYFAESVRSPEAFPACRAASFVKFLTRRNDGINDDVAYMGVDCKTIISGNYYLKTNATPPYGMGPNGISAMA